MKEINQQLQKIITLTPYHLGELIDTVEQVEIKLQDKMMKNAMNVGTIASKHSPINANP